MRSILDLSLEELKKIIEKDELPPEINLTGIEERKDFQKLFRFRSSPRSIATVLLKEKISEGRKGGSHDSPEIKEKRLELKEKELEIKKLKVEGTSYQLKKVFKLLSEMNQKLDFLIKKGGE